MQNIQNIPKFSSLTPLSKKLASPSQDTGEEDSSSHSQTYRESFPNSQGSPRAETSNWSSSLHSVLDQPPAALPQRLMLWGIVFCLLFGSWAWFGKLEEIGKANGELVPEGEPYKVHPIELGKVTKLAVRVPLAIKS